MSSRRVPRWWWSLCLCVGVAGAVPAWAADEVTLKAAVIYKLLLFTDWPAEALPAGHVVLCVSSGSRLLSPLRSLQGQPVGSLMLDVRETLADGALRRCHALFIDQTSRGNPLLQKQLEGAPTLVVTDDASAADGAVVRLFVRDQRIGFDVSLAQARRRGLRLSSKLLRLASTVVE